MQLPTLRQLEYFLAVADNLSFHKAADICGVTQPTLSDGIAKLEDLLGTKLFERAKRDVRLTSAGEGLILPARDIVVRAEDFMHMARARNEPFTGTLTLGVIPTIAPYLLPQILPLLQDAYPQLSLQLKEDVTAQLLRALEDRHVDVVLMAFPYDTPQFTQMKLWSEPFLIAMPGDKPVMERHAHLNDLSRHNIMLLEDGHCLRDHALAACRLQPGRQKTFGATSLTTLIQMVQHGYGSTLLPAMAVGPQSIPKGVTIQRFGNPQPSRQIGLCWRQGNPREQEFRALGKLMIDQRKTAD